MTAKMNEAQKRAPAPKTAAPAAEVSDARVEKELDTLRLRAAVWQPTKDGAARGDRVTLSFAGFDGAGNPIPESRMDGVTVRLGGGGLLPGAEQALFGRRAGERFELAYTYPENFRVAALAGTGANFRIVLHRVERRALPPPDDAFARTQGAKSLVDLRERLRGSLREKRAALARESRADALLAAAGAALDLSAYRDALEQAAEQELRAQEQALERAGETAENFYRRSGHPRAWHWARALARQEKRLRMRLAVEQQAQETGLSVGEAELAAERGRLAARRPAGAALPDDAALRQALLTKKVRNQLLAQAGTEYGGGAARPDGAGTSEE